MKYKLILIPILVLGLFIAGCTTVNNSGGGGIVSEQAVEAISLQDNPEPITEETVVRPAEYQPFVPTDVSNIELDAKYENYSTSVQKMILLCKAGKQNICSMIKNNYGITLE